MPWRDSPRAKVAVHRFEMPGAIESREFEGLDVLIHGALVEYGPAHRDADATNRAGAERVIEIARRHGIRVIFLSTLSAHADARSHYGRNKLELERLFDPDRDCILRLGLVLGQGGLFGNMVGMIRSASFIPLPDGGKQPIQTLWMEDLLDVFERVATRGIAGGYALATAEVTTMRELYETVIAGLGVKRTLVPVPLALVGAGVAVLEALRIPFGINSENVLGIKCLRAYDLALDLAALGITPLPLRESVARLLTMESDRKRERA
ncbi:MAG: hypothetical protein HYR73_03950 [Candidatus Eisenbacteria bacterium]|nr:hypothetical protein [Candidatus Eisenbacteria bacterium]